MPSEKTITIPIKEYIDLLLHSWKDKVAIPTEQAARIFEIDNDEQFCYVEFRSKDAVLWNIKDWRICVEHQKQQKIESERRRQQYYLDDRNIPIVAKALAAKVGVRDWIIMKETATKLVRLHNVEAIRALGLDIKVIV